MYNFLFFPSYVDETKMLKKLIFLVGIKKGKTVEETKYTLFAFSVITITSCGHQRSAIWDTPAYTQKLADRPTTGSFHVV